MLWNWAWRVGRWFGIEVRLHWIFLAYVAFELLAAGFRGAPVHIEAIILLFLFGIVLLHEFGHCYAGRATGGEADRVLLWPLGGLAYVSAANHPTTQLIVAVGGPLVNVGIFLLLTPYVLFGGGSFGSYVLRLPPGDLLSVLYAINLDLLLFNLIPAFPMDGGRILRSLLWYRLGLTRATEICVQISRISAVLMVISGFLLPGHGGILICIGAFVLFAAESERRVVEGGGGSAWQGFTGAALRRGRSVSAGSWLKRRREARVLRRREREARARAAEEAEVDRLLRKVHEDGLPSLSRRERRFLEHASRRYKR
ncbi:MAG: site-2 protease family protein [Planctomycetota bacterium]